MHSQLINVDRHINSGSESGSGDSQQRASVMNDILNEKEKKNEYIDDVVIVTAKSLTSKSINSDTTNTDEVSLQ
jgi:hypothetical protein